MKYNSIEAFVPSGADFAKSRELFLELGFTINWESGDLAGFENGDCKFILQKYDSKEFAENFMMSVKVADLDEFWREVSAMNLPEKFGVKLQGAEKFSVGQRSKFD